jgi:hypothetical protein
MMSGLVGRTLVFIADEQRMRHEIVAVAYDQQAAGIAYSLLLLRIDGTLITHPLEVRGENQDVLVVT